MLQTTSRGRSSSSRKRNSSEEGKQSLFGRTLLSYLWKKKKIGFSRKTFPCFWKKKISLRKKTILFSEIERSPASRRRDPSLPETKVLLPLQQKDIVLHHKKKLNASQKKNTFFLAQFLFLGERHLPIEEEDLL